MLRPPRRAYLQSSNNREAPIGTVFLEETKKSFDLAVEAVKQLITLASAILVFTMTFAEKLGKPTTNYLWLTLTGGWLLLLFSILCGILSLLYMTTALLKKDRIFEPSVASRGIAIPVIFQILFFLLALCLFITYVSYVSCCLPPTLKAGQCP